MSKQNELRGEARDLGVAQTHECTLTPGASKLPRVKVTVMPPRTRSSPSWGACIDKLAQYDLHRGAGVGVGMAAVNGIHQDQSLAFSTFA